MKQIVFIASRAHSGSTLLDLMLSGHPRLIGVGEVYNLFDPTLNYLHRPSEIMCSCGDSVDQCKFWAPVVELLRPAYDRQEDSRELYNIFLSSFYNHFGIDAIPVDISKTDKALGVIKSIKDVEIRVIFLIRDARSWTVSLRDAAKRTKNFEIPDLVKKYGWKAWKPFVERTTIRFFWHWYIRNQRTQRLLSEAGLPTIQIGYEELCLSPELIMKRISEFLKLDYKEDMLSLVDTQSHVILGNRMRNQEDKRRRVAYDDRWFYRSEWMLPAMIFPYIMRYNSLQVYQNVRNRIWNT